MKRQFMLIGAFLLFFFITACAGVPVQGVHMSHKGDVDAGVYTVRVDTFGPGEIPTAVVTGCGERNAKIEVIDLATGKIILTRKDYVPKDWIRWWHFPDLSPGSYQVVLRIGEDIKGTATFNVTK